MAAARMAAATAWRAWRLAATPVMRRGRLVTAAILMLGRRLITALLVTLPATTTTVIAAAMITAIATTAVTAAMVIIMVVVAAANADHHSRAAAIIFGRRIGRFRGSVIAARAVTARPIIACAAINAAGETKGKQARDEDMFHDNNNTPPAPWQQCGKITAIPRQKNPDSPSQACHNAVLRRHW